MDFIEVIAETPSFTIIYIVQIHICFCHAIISHSFQFFQRTGDFKLCWLHLNLLYSSVIVKHLHLKQPKQEGFYCKILPA